MKKTTYKKGDFDKLLKSEPFYYINSDICEKNFPVTHAETENPIILRFDKPFTSEQAMERMKSEGLRGATALELLLYKKNHSSEMKPYDWHLGFGQTVRADGDHRVPCVFACAVGDFKFNLGYFGVGWGAGPCLVCFCDKQPLDSQTIKNDSTETLSPLENAIKICKDNGYKVTMEM